MCIPFGLMLLALAWPSGTANVDRREIEISEPISAESDALRASHALPGLRIAADERIAGWMFRFFGAHFTSSVFTPSVLAELLT